MVDGFEEQMEMGWNGAVTNKIFGKNTWHTDMDTWWYMDDGPWESQEFLGHLLGEMVKWSTFKEGDLPWKRCWTHRPYPLSIPKYRGIPPFWYKLRQSKNRAHQITINHICKQILRFSHGFPYFFRRQKKMFSMVKLLGSSIHWDLKKYPNFTDQKYWDWRP